MHISEKKIVKNATIVPNDRIQVFNRFLLVFVIFALFSSCRHKEVSGLDNQETRSAGAVLSRTIGKKYLDHFVLQIDTTLSNTIILSVTNNRLQVIAATPSKLCRGVYHYLTHACEAHVSWSGSRVIIPESLPVVQDTINTPFDYHYYFNVVTHAYTTPYWDWSRWEKEIDWMALHGIDMPLLPGAHEAILRRVFQQIGLSQTAINKYFTGPCYFPFNRMGCIVGWNGPVPESFFDKQLALHHQIQKRLKELGMHAIVPAFAGFVPEEISELYPAEAVRQLSWGGFERQYQSSILEPGSELFRKIGELYVREYEKEFGKQEFYLADSFNEMDVPLSENAEEALNELAGYGEAVYESINRANPDAVWVMQGWTFPYQRKNGELFWSPERLKALISRIPDDKLIILDLANEYNRLWWHSDPSWMMYPGFFGKKWIYSFIPNMGGKTSLNGRIDLYVTMPYEALRYPAKGNLVGFGFAPEGLENNEIIYELLSDVGWSEEEICLDNWIARYCKNRYGGYPEAMQKAYERFNKSCFATFTDHPRHTYQFRPDTRISGSVNTSAEFEEGVKLFLSCRDQLGDNPLYVADALEFEAQLLGNQADRLIAQYRTGGEQDHQLIEQAITIMLEIDLKLAAHPTWRMEKWISYARNWGDNQEEKDYYESDARRIITTWGGWVNEYSARTWSGLIREYYVPRWKHYIEAKRKGSEIDLIPWEEGWIQMKK